MCMHKKQKNKYNVVTTMLSTRFFYKNILYKNIQDENGQKIKNNAKNMTPGGGT